MIADRLLRFYAPPISHALQSNSNSCVICTRRRAFGMCSAEPLLLSSNSPEPRGAATFPSIRPGCHVTHEAIPALSPARAGSPCLRDFALRVVLSIDKGRARRADTNAVVCGLPSSADENLLHFATILHWRLSIIRASKVPAGCQLQQRRGARSSRGDPRATTPTLPSVANTRQAVHPDRTTPSQTKNSSSPSANYGGTVAHTRQAEHARRMYQLSNPKGFFSAHRVSNSPVGALLDDNFTSQSADRRRN